MSQEEVLRAMPVARYTEARPPEPDARALRGSNQTRVWRARIIVGRTKRMSPEERYAVVAAAHHGVVGNLASWRLVKDRTHAGYRLEIRFFALGPRHAHLQARKVMQQVSEALDMAAYVLDVTRSARMRGENP